MADPYNPVPTVAPSTASPSNYLTNRASPNAFGAQIGQSLQQVGAGINKAADASFNIAIKKQGLLNESYVADAETKMNTQYGEIDGWYKSLKGQAAIQAHDEAVRKVTEVRQNIRKTLPNDAARRSFDLISARSEGFVLREYGNYAGSQLKVATTGANTALRENLVDQTSRYEAATDDERLGFIEGSVADLNRKLVVDAGWDLDTPEGKAVLAQENDKVLDKIWTNIANALAFDPDKGDVKAAVEKLQQHKNSIPAATYARLSQQLSGPYRSIQARDIANQELGRADQDYTKQVTTVAPLPPPPGAKSSEGNIQPYHESTGSIDVPTIADKFIQQESGGDFRTGNIGQIQPGTWKQFAKPGEDITSPIDNRKVTERIIDQYTKDYNGDMSRVAVAYFSGPGNVSEPGSANPWKQDFSDKSGKKTSSYVQDMLGRLGSSDTQTQEVSRPTFITKAEYYERNRGEIIKRARDRAFEQFHDPRIADEAGSRAEQYLNDVIQAENGKKAADSELIRRFAFGEGNNGQLISNINQLDNGPPEIREAWQRMQMNNPLGAQAIKTNVLTANSRGRALEYGTDFWKHYSDVLTGKIKSVDELYPFVGGNKNSPLTNTGLSQLGKEMELAKSPEGMAFLQSERAYFEKMRSSIVGGVNTRNANGERIFQRAMMQALPKIQAGRAQGLTAGDLFDEDSPDYIGGASAYDPRTLAERTNDAVTIQAPVGVDTLTGNPYQGPIEPLDIKKLDGIKDVKTLQQELIKRNKQKPFTPEEKSMLEEYLTKRNSTQKILPPEVPSVQ